MTTAFPAINVTLLLMLLTGLLLAGCLMFAVFNLRGRPAPTPVTEPAARRETWTMPPLALLGKPAWSRTRTLTSTSCTATLAIAVILLVVKATRLAGG